MKNANGQEYVSRLSVQLSAVSASASDINEMINSLNHMGNGAVTGENSPIK